MDEESKYKKSKKEGGKCQRDLFEGIPPGLVAWSDQIDRTQGGAEDVIVVGWIVWVHLTGCIEFHSIETGCVMKCIDSPIIWWPFNLDRVCAAEMAARVAGKIPLHVADDPTGFSLQWLSGFIMALDRQSPVPELEAEIVADLDHSNGEGTGFSYGRGKAANRRTDRSSKFFVGGSCMRRQVPCVGNGVNGYLRKCDGMA
jgi:hypothetical protein